VLPVDEDNRSHLVKPLLPVGLYIGLLDRYTERTMQSTAETVAEYLETLSPERRAMVETLRSAILKYLPEGYQETMQYGMISYVVPFSRYPKTYNNQPLAIASLASQKNYVSTYLMGIYGDTEAEAWLEKAFADAGKRLDMGKSCIRFKKPEDIPVDVMGQAVSLLSVDEFIEVYESSRA